MGPQERPPKAASSSSIPTEPGDFRPAEAMRLPSSSSCSPAAIKPATSKVSLERYERTIRSSAVARSTAPRSTLHTTLPSTSTSPLATFSRMPRPARSPQRRSPAAKYRKTVRFQTINTSMRHQPSMNSTLVSTHESSAPTSQSQTSTHSHQTPTAERTASVYPPSRPEGPFHGGTNPPLLPVSPVAATKSKTVSHAREIMDARQDSATHNPTRPPPFGVGLTHHEVARLAEAEKVRIQEYAARKTAENNPRPPQKALRREAITAVKAATNRRLDAQAYATRMATQTEAEKRAQQMYRVEADVYGTAPQMAEPTRETIEAAQILMQLQKVHIAGLQYMIREAEQQVAAQQAAERQAAEIQAAQHRAAQRQAASEVDLAATRLMSARYGWNLQLEEQRRERERARNEMERQLNEEWHRRNLSIGRSFFPCRELDLLTRSSGGSSGGFSGGFSGGLSGGPSGGYTTNRRLG